MKHSNIRVEALNDSGESAIAKSSAIFVALVLVAMSAQSVYSQLGTDYFSPGTVRVLCAFLHFFGLLLLYNIGVIRIMTSVILILGLLSFSYAWTLLNDNFDSTVALSSYSGWVAFSFISLGLKKSILRSCGIITIYSLVFFLFVLIGVDWANRVIAGNGWAGTLSNNLIIFILALIFSHEFSLKRDIKKFYQIGLLYSALSYLSYYVDGVTYIQQKYLVALGVPVIAYLIHAFTKPLGFRFGIGFILVFLASSILFYEIIGYFADYVDKSRSFYARSEIFAFMLYSSIESMVSLVLGHGLGASSMGFEHLRGLATHSGLATIFYDLGWIFAFVLFFCLFRRTRKFWSRQMFLFFFTLAFYNFVYVYGVPTGITFLQNGSGLIAFMVGCFRISSSRMLAQCNVPNSSRSLRPTMPLLRDRR